MSKGNHECRAESRYETVSRRAFLKRAGLAAGAITLFPSLAACSGEAETFDQAPSTAAPTTLAAATPTTLSDVATTGAPPPVTTTAEVAASSSMFPEGAEMLINFTYAASDSGSRVRNPYVAVWVEDSTGELVNTVALWFLQTRKGTRWVSDLRRWSSVDGSDTTVDTISSATRTPGDYSVVWNLADFEGKPVEQGEYFICIESAREHGPYSLVREPIAVNAETGSVALSDDGELSAATVAMSMP